MTRKQRDPMTRRTRRTQATETTTQEEITTVTDTPDSTDTMLSAAQEAATELLASLPSDLVSDELRSAVLTATHGATVCAKVAQAVTEAQAGVQTALAAGDVLAATASAAELAALERLATYLPSVTVDPVAVANALAVAGQYVGEADLTIPPLPTVDYTVEMAAWRSLPRGFQDETPVPIATEADITAQGVLEQLTTERAVVKRTVEAWRRNLEQSPDPLSHVSAAASTAEQCRKHAAESTRAVAAIESANQVRREAGLSWRAPRGVITDELLVITADK